MRYLFLVSGCNDEKLVSEDEPKLTRGSGSGHEEKGRTESFLRQRECSKTQM